MTRVAVADDHQNFRSVLAHMLRREGYDVVELDNGAALVALVLSDQPPHAVVTDVRIPFESALDVLERMREHGVSIPTIVMSGDTSDVLRAEATRLGAVAVLQKPFTLEELFELLIAHVPRPSRTSRSS